MPERPKPRAISLLAATAIALLATCYGGMLSIANQRTLHPDQMTWLDAPPMPVQEAVAEPTDVEAIEILDTAANR